jgi:hypothetical protein
MRVPEPSFNFFSLAWHVTDPSEETRINGMQVTHICLTITASQDASTLGWLSDAKSCVIFITLAGFPCTFSNSPLLVPNAVVQNMFDYSKKKKN